MRYQKQIQMAVIAISLFALADISSHAQSTDIDNPTAMTSTTIEGAGDGKGETVYYSFDAMKGDVKITVDAKTDYYSTPVQVTLLDENAKELLPIYVVAKGESQREVRTRYFVRDQKVIVRISTRDDSAVKLLNYKVRVEGSVTFTPAVASDPQKQGALVNDSSGAATGGSAPATDTGQSAVPVGDSTGSPPPATETGQPGETPSATDPNAGSGTKKSIKKKAKDAAKEALKKIIDN